MRRTALLNAVASDGDPAPPLAPPAPLQPPLTVGVATFTGIRRVIASASPETAAAIDAAAEHVRLPFWSRIVIRNTLAWLLVTVITTAYVAGTVLFPPWGAIVVALLSVGGLTGPSAHKRVAAPRPAPDEPPDDQ